MDINFEKDYYAILGVSPSATGEEIKRAHRKLARRYHPDSRTVNTATMLFHEVQEAYAVLGDPESRRAYDRRRAEKGLSESAAFSWTITPSTGQLCALHNEQVLYLLVEIEPGITSAGKQLPLNLCLVIDRSTSMQGARMDHVKEAARQIIRELDEKDAFALVTFSDRAEVVLPSEFNTNKPQAKTKVAVIRAGGGTEILQGLTAGLAEIQKRHSKHVISHLILLTDGRTYGDEKGCIAAARRAGARHIGISTMGIGEDWNDALLDEMASLSGGTSAYIASPGQVRALLRKKVRGLEKVFAQNMTLKVRSADGVQMESAFLTSPYLEPLPSNSDGINLGTLETDSPMNVVLKLGVTQKPNGKHRLLQLELTGDVPTTERQEETLKQDVHCTFTGEEPPLTEIPPVLLNALSRITLYQMQEQAWNALDSGDVDKATSRLEMMATRLLDLGEKQLAKAAMLEAGRIAGGGIPTDRGRKELKYGTRSLVIASRREGYD